MRIALINENSQAAKNATIEAALKKVVTPRGHQVDNYGMYGKEGESQLTYVQNGILAAILLNSGAADYVVTGCGTGEGAMLALNSFPGVICGHVVDPSDGFMFAQINDGNAVSMPFAKGFGWGAELNLEYTFEKLFGFGSGNGYPAERVVFEPHLAVHIAPVERAVVAQGFKLFLRKAAHVLLQDIQHLRLCIRIRARDFIRHFQLHTQSRFQRFGHTWVVQPTADDLLHALKVPGFIKPLNVRRKRVAQAGKIKKHTKSLPAFYPTSSRTYAMICSSFAWAKNSSAKCSPATAPRTSS